MGADTGLMTAKDVAKAMNCSIATARKIMKKDGFPLVKFGNKFVVGAADFLDWKNKKSNCSSTNTSEQIAINHEVFVQEQLEQIKKEKSEIKLLLLQVEQRTAAIEESREINKSCKEKIELIHEMLKTFGRDIDSMKYMEYTVQSLEDELKSANKISRIKSLVLGIVLLCFLLMLVLLLKG